MLMGLLLALIVGCSGSSSVNDTIAKLESGEALSPPDISSDSDLPSYTDDMSNEPVPDVQENADSTSDDKNSPMAHYAVYRPLSTHTIRLHFSHLCVLKNEGCQREFDIGELSEFARYADGMHFTFGLLPSKSLLDQLHAEFPEIKILGKGVGFNVLYDQQMLHPNQSLNITVHDHSINSAYRTIRTSIHPRDWAMDIIPNPDHQQHGLLVTSDSLISYAGGGQIKNDLFASGVQGEEQIDHMNCMNDDTALYIDCMQSVYEKISMKIAKLCADDANCIVRKEREILQCRRKGYHACAPLFPKSPLNYNFEVMNLSEVLASEFPEHADSDALPGQYLLGGHCRRRQFMVMPVSTLLSDQELQYLNSGATSTLLQGHTPIGLSAGLSLFSLRAFKRTSSGISPFFKEWWFDGRYSLSIEDGACLAFDPGKERTSEVFAQGISAFTEEYHADGVIMDDLPKEYRGTDTLAFEVGGEILRQNKHELNTVAVPWVFPGEEKPRYLIGLGKGMSTPHARIYDDYKYPEQVFAKAFLNFASDTRRQLQERTTKVPLWCINMNTVSSQFEHSAESFENWMVMAQQTTVPCIWDEKWGRDLGGTERSLRNLYLKLYTVHHASKSNQMAILWSMYLNYNDTDLRPYLTSFFDISKLQKYQEVYKNRYGSNHIYNLERGLVRYLLVLDQPSIQLQPYRYTKVDNDTTIDINGLHRLLSTESWLKTILNLNAGNPLMKTAGIAGKNSLHRVMYRQYENALVLLNTSTTDALRVTLPARHCTDCDLNYYYIRMIPWQGIDRDDGNAIVPLHYMITDTKDGRSLTDVDAYAAGSSIVIPPKESVLLFNNEAIAWDTLSARKLRQGVYLRTYQRCRSDDMTGCTVETVPAFNEDAPIQLLIQDNKYMHFLTIPDHIDDNRLYQE